VAEKLLSRLREVRTDRGLTQAQLAEMAGVSRKTINTVENGIFVPSTILSLRLAQVLGVRVEDLFQLDG
jgi:putative transcriptional regulator